MYFAFTFWITLVVGFLFHIKQLSGLLSRFYNELQLRNIEAEDERRIYRCVFYT